MDQTSTGSAFPVNHFSFMKVLEYLSIFLVKASVKSTKAPSFK
jgi:hypothetical protein